MIPKGKTTYSFVFQLPDRIPSSFDGDRGHILYEIKGIDVQASNYH